MLRTVIVFHSNYCFILKVQSMVNYFQHSHTNDANPRLILEVSDKRDQFPYLSVIFNTNTWMSTYTKA